MRGVLRESVATCLRVLASLSNRLPDEGTPHPRAGANIVLLDIEGLRARADE